MVPILAFLGSMFILTVYFQKYPLQWWKAILTVLLISVTGTIVFQIVAYLDLGYLDPLFQIAMTVQLVAGIVVGAFATLIKVLWSVSQL